MQLMIDAADVATAPIEVRTWFANVLALGPMEPVHLEAVVTQEAPAVTQEAPVVSDATPVANPQNQEATQAPDITEVMTKAVDLISAKGEDVLAEILKKLDIRRVKECPEDKRAALLAEIAIHA